MYVSMCVFLRHTEEPPGHESLKSVYRQRNRAGSQQALLPRMYIYIYMYVHEITWEVLERTPIHSLEKSPTMPIESQYVPGVPRAHRFENPTHTCVYMYMYIRIYIYTCVYISQVLLFLLFAPEGKAQVLPLWRCVCSTP